MRTRKTPKERETKVLRPIHPNLGIELAYRRRLNALIEEMHDSIVYWVASAYRQNQPRIAQDASPADFLASTIKHLTSRWTKRFDEMAEKMAEFFTQSVNKQSSLAMKKILKDAGWTVQFKLTPAMRDVVDATVNANVSLIKSIPAQYLGKVEGMVMRSVQTGRDLGQLSKDLQAEFGVTKRRAALIAKDQNNKATAALTRTRNLELGLEEAIWVHSAGGREPRQTHVKAGKEKTRYKIAEGWKDPDPRVNRYIQPGELINCRCIGRPVIKGFS